MMHRIRRLWLQTGLALALGSMPVSAHASGADIQQIFLGLIAVFAPIGIPVAILVVTIAGFTLMISQEEGKLAKARSTLIAAGIGGILATIITVLGPLNAVSILYNGLPGTILINTGGVIAGEAEGVAGWLIAMAAMLGVLMIIIAVIRAVLSFGDEGSYSAVRLAVMHVIIGITVIAAALIFKQVFFFDRHPGALIALIANRIILVLGIISTLAVAILIYAGLRMVVSFGREEEFSAAKSLALRVVVGLLVITLAFALVFVVVMLFQ